MVEWYRGHARSRLLSRLVPWDQSSALRRILAVSFSAEGIFGELYCTWKLLSRCPCEENQAVIKQLKKEKITSSAKHVDNRFMFICHYAEAKVVQPRFVNLMI